MEKEKEKERIVLYFPVKNELLNTVLLMLGSKSRVRCALILQLPLRSIRCFSAVQF